MNKYSILEFDGNDKYIIQSVDTEEEFKEFIIKNFDPKKSGVDFLTKELYFANSTKIFLNEKPKFYYNKHFNNFNTGKTLMSWELVENKPFKNNINDFVKNQFNSDGLNDILFSSIKKCQEGLSNIIDNLDKSTQNVTDALEDILVYSLEKREKSPDVPLCNSFVNFFKPTDPFNEYFYNMEDLEELNCKTEKEKQE